MKIGELIEPIRIGECGVDDGVVGAVKNHAHVGDTSLARILNTITVAVEPDAVAIGGVSAIDARIPGGILFGEDDLGGRGSAGSLVDVRVGGRIAADAGGEIVAGGEDELGEIVTGDELREEIVAGLALHIITRDVGGDEVIV